MRIKHTEKSTINNPENDALAAPKLASIVLLLFVSTGGNAFTSAAATENHHNPLYNNNNVSCQDEKTTERATSNRVLAKYTDEHRDSNRIEVTSWLGGARIVETSNLQRP